MFGWLANAWRVPELRRRVLFTAGDPRRLPARLVDSRTGGRPAGAAEPLQRRRRPLAAQPLLGLRAVAVLALRARDHAVRHGVDHRPAADRRRSRRSSGCRRKARRGTPKINQYTRYLTVTLAAAQATGYAFLFKRQGALPNVNAGRLVIIILTLTAGCTLLMWMGEQITKRGIGNGISLLIFASILAYAPDRGHRVDQRRHAGASLVPDHRDRGRRRGRLRTGRSTANPGAVRPSTARQSTNGGRIDLHAAAREHGRRHPGHLRRRVDGASADGGPVRPGLERLREPALPVDGPACTSASRRR